MFDNPTVTEYAIAILFFIVSLGGLILAMWLLGMQKRMDLIMMERSEMQQTDYSCGAVALRNVLMLLGQSGRGVTEFELMRRLRSDQKIGTLQEDIVRVAHDLGWEAELLLMDIPMIQEMLALGRPVLVDIKIGGEGHYIVVNDIDSDNVYYLDSYYTRTKMARDEFAERWDGMGIVIW